MKKYPDATPNIKETKRQIHVVESGDSYLIITSRQNIITKPAPNPIPAKKIVLLINLYPNSPKNSPSKQKIGTNTALFSFINSETFPISARGHPYLLVV